MMDELNSGKVQSVFYRAEAGYTIRTRFFSYNRRPNKQPDFANHMWCNLRKVTEQAPVKFRFWLLLLHHVTKISLRNCELGPINFNQLSPMLP